MTGPPVPNCSRPSASSSPPRWFRGHHGSAPEGSLPGRADALRIPNARPCWPPGANAAAGPGSRLTAGPTMPGSARRPGRDAGSPFQRHLRDGPGQAIDKLTVAYPGRLARPGYPRMSPDKPGYALIIEETTWTSPFPRTCSLSGRTRRLHRARDQPLEARTTTSASSTIAANTRAPTGTRRPAAASGRRCWREARSAADAAGHYRYAWPDEMGGKGGSNLAMAVIREHLAAKGLGLHNDLQNEHSIVGNNFACCSCARFGSPEQQASGRAAAARPASAPLRPHRARPRLGRHLHGDHARCATRTAQAG